MAMPKNLETRIAELEAELQQGRKEFDDFVYRVSHDLQAPLRAVIGFGGLLARAISERLSPEEREDLDMMISSAHRAQALLDSTLRFGRLSSAPRNIVPVDCDTLVAESVAFFKKQIAEAGATITIDKLPVVMADETMLGQIFTRLLDNALKFSAPGKPPVIHISARKKGDRWVITIADNGIGVAEKHQDKIFELFRKLYGDQYPGLGEGLAFVKRLMGYLGGEITVEAAPEQGAKFHLSFPVSEGV